MERVFIDTNVIIDLLRGKEKVVTFFKRIELGDVIGFTNKVVFLETVHVYLILTTREGPLNLRKKPELISSADLTPILEIFDILQILPIDPIKERDVVEIITKYGLLPNDALVLATCKNHSIKYLISIDREDFTIPCEKERIILIDSAEKLKEILNKYFFPLSGVNRAVSCNSSFIKLKSFVIIIHRKTQILGG